MDEKLLSILIKIGITPQDEQIYSTAFTHRSFLNESKKILTSNETLEFLGDAVLSFIISTYLYKMRPSDTEGDLTNLRAFMVKSQSLGKAAQNLSLGEFLKLSRGEELSGGRTNLQLLANSYEALLGAIFLDLGIETATRFVHKTLLPLFETEVKTGAPRDSKSILQEFVQSKFQKSPKYKILEASGPDHAKKFVVGVFLQGEQIGIGEGANKHSAEEQAANQALETLRGV